MRRVKHTVLLSAALIISMAAAGCGESAPAAVSETADSQEQEEQETAAETTSAASTSDDPDSGEIGYADLEDAGSMSLQYAEEFQVEDLKPAAGTVEETLYRRITIPEDDQQFLLIPDGAPVPSDIPHDIVILQQPLDRTYLVSSSVMDYICTIDALDQIRFSGTKEDDWTISEAQEAMDLGYVLYAGKYNEPDYELILSEGCNFAIENTMIYHNPDVKEKLEELGIPVMVDRSSYESNPLGRLEWIRLYGVLFNKEDAADAWYRSELEKLEPILQEEGTGKTAAFFAVNSNGAVTIRKPGDYISRLIEMAGGRYIFTQTEGEEENALSTMTIQMEEFYATAKEADVLIYNSTIEGEIRTTEDLLAKSELFADFSAVQNGTVYCTGQNLYQQPTGMGDFLRDLHAVFTEKDPGDLVYLTRVQ